MSLRSPLRDEVELAEYNATVNNCISAINRSIRIHANSTCKFNLALQLDVEHTLIQAKKLAMLVWLTEKTLLISLRHPRCNAKTYPRPVTAESVMAAQIHSPSIDYPKDPLLVSVMNGHVPADMEDAAQGQCLRRMWGGSNLSHLSGALRDHRQDALAFKL